MHSVMTRLHTLLLTFHGVFLAKKNRDPALRVARYSCLIQKANLALERYFAFGVPFFLKFEKREKSSRKTKVCLHNCFFYDL